MLVEYQRSVAALHDARPTVTSVIKAGDRTEDIKRKIAALQSDSTALIASVHKIAQAIDTIYYANS